MSQPARVPFRRLLARLGRVIMVANPAVCWLYLREGALVARAYLRHLVVGYAGRTFLADTEGVPALIPQTPPATAFPEVELEGIELLRPVRQPGSVTLDELFLLCALVRARRPKLMVEIGTASGRTTLNLAAHAPDEARVITFDLPDHAAAAGEGAGPDFRQFGLGQPGRMFAGTPQAAKIEQVRADTTTYDWSALEGRVEFLFIDGSHTYEDVAKDGESALRMVKPGGLIVWHDYAQMPGVTRALNELLGRHKLVWLAETSLAVLRR